MLDNPRQLRASLRLTQYLRCRFGIKLANVIGHNESLSSPYHHELVPSLRNQTHGDWKHSSMRIYRKRLWRLGPLLDPPEQQQDEQDDRDQAEHPSGHRHLQQHQHQSDNYEHSNQTTNHRRLLSSIPGTDTAGLPGVRIGKPIRA